jgi:hypothetical protein
MELEKKIAEFIESMKSGNRCGLILLFIAMNSIQVYGLTDTLNVSIYLKNKLVVDHGKVIKNRVKLTSKHLELKDGYYLLKPFQKDTIHINLKFNHYNTNLILNFPRKEREIHLRKTKYTLRLVGLHFNYLYVKFVCPEYYINIHHPNGESGLKIMKKECWICK